MSPVVLRHFGCVVCVSDILGDLDAFALYASGPDSLGLNVAMVDYLQSFESGKGSDLPVWLESVHKLQTSSWWSFLKGVAVYGVESEEWLLQRSHSFMVSSVTCLIFALCQPTPFCHGDILWIVCLQQIVVFSLSSSLPCQGGLS